MQVSKSPSIRSQLVLLVMGCILPAVAMAALLIFHDYQRAREQLASNSLSTVHAMAAVLDGDLATITASLNALGTSPHLASHNFAAFYDQAKDVLQHQFGDNIVLSDLRGAQLINTSRPYGAQLPSHARTIPMAAMARTGKPMVSDLFYGPIFGRPAIAVGVPVHCPGIEICALSSGVFAERFVNLLHRQNLPPGWTGVIFDGNGTVVARTRDNTQNVGKKSFPLLLQKISGAREGAFERVTSDGIPAVTVFSRSAVSNWTVAIDIPTSALKHELWRTLSWLILAAAILLACSLGMAWWIGDRIARSIRGLRGPALALGAGDAVVVPPLHVKEADEVGASLVRASGMLHEARHQARHDALTGLPNRALIAEIVEKQLALCQRNGSFLSVLYIDLDGFKKINDEYGHAMGDRLLCMVAERLKTGIRESDLAARLGGDEFGVVLIDAAVEDAAVVAGKLVDSLSVPYVIDALEMEISASIGVAGFPDSGLTGKAIFHCADDAMYEAKALGKRRVVVAREVVAKIA
ncbi:MAG TPA: sensor domain-containing diguanylate cyclase [Noviherbaspirillum sp.]|uniref:sensor domain-containing diguanylate cyclase n=1 Tax=Noviherbaspirillum sp. TaxID=1926288 RepID=UPI002B48F799|nr:sensor domain-containing diguanylate cyclase [Noviherbaspirillum sp.]HJV85237.1 sensor domain-containing diguanylate cyclase [Noviherbaspirillum sp.]